MSVMRIRYKKLGGHIHCRVFTAPWPDQTFAKVGELVFDEREWPDVRDMLRTAQLVKEDQPDPS